MCHNNLLTNCRKIEKLDEFQKGNRYIEGMRRGDGLCWIWVLKICVALL